MTEHDMSELQGLVLRTLGVHGPISWARLAHIVGAQAHDAALREAVTGLIKSGAVSKTQPGPKARYELTHAAEKADERRLGEIESALRDWKGFKTSLYWRLENDRAELVRRMKAEGQPR